MTPTRPMLLLALAGDLVCVLLFALGGHQSHEADASQLVTLRIAWPFIVGCLVGWVVVVARSWAAYAVRPAGLTVLAATYVLGLLLRVVSGRGVSGGFPIVTLVFLALTLLGWRLILGLVRARRQASRPAGRPKVSP